MDKNPCYENNRPRAIALNVTFAELFVLTQRRQNLAAPNTNIALDIFSQPIRMGVSRGNKDAMMEDDVMELDDTKMVEHLGTLKLHDECGESFDKLTVLNFPVDTTDEEVTRYVTENFPVWRCQHSYDCCGNFYPRTPSWTRLRPTSCRVVVTQSWQCNI